MHIIYFDALQESNHTFLSLHESYADDKFYLTEDDVEVIPKVIIAFVYENCRPFSEGLAIVGVYKSDKARKDKDTTQTDWSFIDEKGYVVLNLDDDYFIEPRHRPSMESLHLKSQKYLASGVFKNGLCLVQKKKEYPENTQELRQSRSVLIDARHRTDRRGWLFQDGKVVQGHPRSQW